MAQYKAELLLPPQGWLFHYITISAHVLTTVLARLAGLIWQNVYNNSNKPSLHPRWAEGNISTYTNHHTPWAGWHHHGHRLINTGQSSTLLFEFVCPHDSLRLLFLVDRSGTECGLLWGYLNHLKVWCVAHSETPSCSPRLKNVLVAVVSPDHSGHYSLTSLTKKVFQVTDSKHTGGFFLSRDFWVWKSQDFR